MGCRECQRLIWLLKKNAVEPEKALQKIKRQNKTSAAWKVKTVKRCSCEKRPEFFFSPEKKLLNIWKGGRGQESMCEGEKVDKEEVRTGTTAAMLECGMREGWRISWVPWWKILVLAWIELTATSSQAVVISLMKKTRDRKSLKHSALISNPALPSSLSKIRSYVQGPVLFF